MTDLALTMWIDRGMEVPGLTSNPFRNLDMPFRYYALVQLTRSSAGTIIRWDPSHANESSVAFAAQRLAESPAPYTIEYFKQGWFSERFGTVEAALNRVEQVQRMREVPVLRRFFSQAKPVDESSPVLRHAMQEPERFNDVLIYAAIDDDMNFPVISVGKHSLLAKVMGPEWVDGGQYNIEGGDADLVHEVTRSYLPVIDTGTPHYDDALMRIYPDTEEPRWLNCQRLIWPARTSDGKFAMAAFCTQVTNTIDLFSAKSH